MADLTDLVLPSLGEGVTEAFVVEWLVPVGARVDVGDAVVEVMTDKANVEVESTAAGEIVEHRFAPEARVLVGEALAVIRTDV